jgi:transposase
VGRPCSYTDEAGQKILVAIRAGLPVKFAAAKASVGLRTLYDWLERGEREGGDPALVAFAQLYREAEAEYAAQELARIDADAAADSNAWKARAWKLERRFPREFGSKVALEHSGPEGGPIESSATVTARVVVLPPIHDPVARDDSVAPEPGTADGVSE